MAYCSFGEIKPGSDGFRQRQSVACVGETSAEAIKGLLIDHVGGGRRACHKAPGDPTAPLHQVPVPHEHHMVRFSREKGSQKFI